MLSWEKAEGRGSRVRSAIRHAWRFAIARANDASTSSPLKAQSSCREVGARPRASPNVTIPLRPAADLGGLRPSHKFATIKARDSVSRAATKA